MNRLKWLRIVNVFLASGFLSVAISIALYLSPIQSLNGNEVLREIHEIGGKIFFILAVVHIVLNWNWIQAQYLKKKKAAPKPAPKKTK